MILNVGCGTCTDPHPDVINVDRVAYPGVDVVWDLDTRPWPFEPGSATEVRAIQVFEHVTDPVGFMVEGHRVLAAGGLLEVRTPDYRCENAFTDPTHRRYCTPRTWDYWIPGTALWAQFAPAYGGDTARFDAESITTDGVDITARLRKLP